MPILREWRGEIRKALSAEYVEYISGTGLADYRNTPGNLGALIAVRDIDAERTEVITLVCGLPGGDPRVRGGSTGSGALLPGG